MEAAEPPAADAVPDGDVFVKAMQNQGMVRADEADLSALDDKPRHPDSAANGSALSSRVHASNGSLPRGATPEIEEQRSPADFLDETKAQDWEIDMSKVLCINLLAAGSFGKVFYGMYRSEDVAVKLMNLPATMSHKEVQALQSSFRQEIAVWHKLHHPNVVEFIGASLNASNIVAPPDALPGPGQPVWAIVTEYMSGGTLKSYLTRKRKLPMKDTLKFALDISRGLEYLHSKDVVHRDMKSDNLLLDSKNNLKIADFGVARTEAKNPVDMTCETGTVRWMAPEVIEHKPYTRKVDVYSFGIVLWELVTCDHPFKDLSFVQLAYNVVNKGLRPTIPESCNSALAELMRECWDKDPDKRPDFSQVVKRLEALQQEQAHALQDSSSTDSVSGGCACVIS